MTHDIQSLPNKGLSKDFSSLAIGDTLRIPYSFFSDNPQDIVQMSGECLSDHAKSINADIGAQNEIELSLTSEPTIRITLVEKIR